MIWNKTAETIANYTTTGSLISVEGDIKTSSYENNEGQTVYKTELSVNSFEFLETKETTERRREKSRAMENSNQPYNGQ